MSETPTSAVPPVEIPGTVVDEVPHPTPVERVPAGAPVNHSPAAPLSSALANAAAPAATSAMTTAAPSDAAPTATVADAPAAPAADETQKTDDVKASGRRSLGMASGGKPVTELPPPPEAPEWPSWTPDAPGTPVTLNGAAAVDEAYVPDEEFDATDLMQVNRELNRARARIFRCSQTLRRVQRALAEAQVAYDRQMRRALVTQSGGTAESRRALAEIACEEFENRVVIGKQVVEEWRRRCNDARDDLKALENISHNVRASIDIR